MSFSSILSSVWLPRALAPFFLFCSTGLTHSFSLPSHQVFGVPRALAPPFWNRPSCFPSFSFTSLSVRATQDSCTPLFDWTSLPSLSSVWTAQGTVSSFLIGPLHYSGAAATHTPITPPPPPPPPFLLNRQVHKQWRRHPRRWSKRFSLEQDWGPQKSAEPKNGESATPSKIEARLVSHFYRIFLSFTPS